MEERTGLCSYPPPPFSIIETGKRKCPNSQTLTHMENLYARIDPLFPSRKCSVNKRMRVLKEYNDKEIQIEDNNFEACLQNFVLLSDTEIEEYYHAFCRYAKRVSIKEEDRKKIDFFIFQKYAGDPSSQERFFYYFKVEENIYSLSKLWLAAIKSSFFNAIFFGNIPSPDASKRDPLLIPECDNETFLQIIQYIYNPCTYSFPEDQGESFKDLLWNLLEKAEFFDLPQLRRLCEKALKPFVVREIGKEVYEYAVERQFPQLQRIAVKSFAGLHQDKRSQENESSG